MTIPAYTWLGSAGLLISIVFWSRLARRDTRLLWIYIASLVGAFVGAKAAYFAAEGWRDLGQPDMWLRLATGKSILGGLFGGYMGVEIAKWCFGYHGITGDWFACIVPAGIALGRIGCWVHGCCAGAPCAPSWFTINDVDGISRWPSAPVELLFNLVALAAFFWLRHKRLFAGQHFHIYLMAYGVFRFAHEFVRSEPRLLWNFTGYHALALLLFIFGLFAFNRRKKTGISLKPLFPEAHRPPVGYAKT